MGDLKNAKLVIQRKFCSTNIYNSYIWYILKKKKYNKPKFCIRIHKGGIYNSSSSLPALIFENIAGTDFKV